MSEELCMKRLRGVAYHLKEVGFFGDATAISEVVKELEALSRPAPSAPVAREHDDDIKQMMKFYAVHDLVSLARIQSEHVARLQKKLPPMRDESPLNPRAGGE